MTEKQKMLAGQLYDCSDEELVKARQRARKLVRQYNNTDDEQAEERNKLLHELFGSIKGSAFVEPDLRVDYGCNIHVGDNFYANFNLTVLDCAEVKIGDNCMFGPNVMIVTPIHPLLAEDRNVRKHKDGTTFDYEYAKPITIGNNVWLASGVTVNGGVTIGDNTVIGSGSVVTRDIPSGVIAVGNPCRVLRKLTQKDKMLLPQE